MGFIQQLAAGVASLYLHSYLISHFLHVFEDLKKDIIAGDQEAFLLVSFTALAHVYFLEGHSLPLLLTYGKAGARFSTLWTSL